MITFRPYSVPGSRPHFGQKGQPPGIQVLVPIWGLTALQKSQLKELEEVKKGDSPMIAKVEQVQNYGELVRVTLAPGQNAKEFVQLLREKGITAIPPEDAAYQLLNKDLEITPGDYAFATMFPSPNGRDT